MIYALMDFNNLIHQKIRVSYCFYDRTNELNYIFEPFICTWTFMFKLEWYDRKLIKKNTGTSDSAIQPYLNVIDDLILV